jgi:hypothetical protein
MLRARTVKILLQQYRHIAAQSHRGGMSAARESGRATPRRALFYSLGTSGTEQSVPHTLLEVPDHTAVSLRGMEIASTSPSGVLNSTT